MKEKCHYWKNTLYKLWWTLLRQHMVPETWLFFLICASSDFSSHHLLWVVMIISPVIFFAIMFLAQHCILQWSLTLLIQADNLVEDICNSNSVPWYCYYKKSMKYVNICQSKKNPAPYKVTRIIVLTLSLKKKIHLNKFNKVTLSNGLNFDYSNWLFQIPALCFLQYNIFFFFSPKRNSTGLSDICKHL